MIKEITFPKDYQLSRIMFFETADITQMTNPKIVPLFGPNGIGKSTMIQGIKNQTIFFFRTVAAAFCGPPVYEKQ